jgi:hypothetical protein
MAIVRVHPLSMLGTLLKVYGCPGRRVAGGCTQSEIFFADVPRDIGWKVQFVQQTSCRGAARSGLMHSPGFCWIELSESA